MQDIWAVIICCRTSWFFIKATRVNFSLEPLSGAEEGVWGEGGRQPPLPSTIAFKNEGFRGVGGGGAPPAKFTRVVFAVTGTNNNAPYNSVSDSRASHYERV